MRDPRRLQIGKPFAKFGRMRPREMLANWLLCATLQQIEGRELMFYSDPVGAGGIIRDEATGEKDADGATRWCRASLANATRTRAAPHQ